MVHWRKHHRWEVTVAAHGAEHAKQPSRDEPASVEELARRQGVRPVESVDDMTRPGLFESDEEWQEFLADLCASRQSGLASASSSSTPPWRPPLSGEVLLIRSGLA